MTLIQYVRLLLRRWIPIGLATVVLTVGVYLVSNTRTPQYTASASEYFTLAFSNSPAELAQGSDFLQNQMSSFGQLATSPIVLNPVKDDLALPMTLKQLGRMITATTPRNTVVMQVSVTTSDPAQAAAIANAVSSELTSAVEQVSPKLPNGKSLVSVRSIQSALPPTVQSSPNTRRDTLFGFVIGLLLSCLVAIAAARLDNTVRTPAVLAEVTTRRLLGSVRFARSLSSRAVIIDTDPQSRIAEDLRQVRAGLEQLGAGRQTFAVVITSSIREEGRSTIAANLAAALAEAGRSTVLVEADLRRPQVAQLTGTDPELGLFNALADPSRTSECVQTSLLGSLAILPAGEHANPVELLSSPAMGQVISALRRDFEFVIIDSPALLDAADAAVMHSHVDGALIIAHAKRVHRDQLENALRSGELAWLKILGVVMNAVRSEDMPLTDDRSTARHWPETRPQPTRVPEDQAPRSEHTQLPVK